MDCKGFLCCCFFFYTTDRYVASVLTHGEKLRGLELKKIAIRINGLHELALMKAS